MSAPELRIVGLAELRIAWLAVRDRVAKLGLDNEEPWIADDIYHELVNQTAFLWVTPEYAGFVVLEINVTPYLSELHVWIADNETEARAAEFWPQLKIIGEGCKCQRVTFASRRNGWRRAMPNLQVRHIYFEDL